MRIARKFGLIAICLVVVFTLGVAGLRWFVRRPHIHATSEPVTREAAAKVLRPDLLPASAHDIQYSLQYLEITPGFTSCIRFEAPVRDCLVAADRIMSEFRHEPGADSANSRLTVKETPIKRVSHPKPLQNPEVPPWFDIARIANGIATGDGSNGEMPRIWVDQQRGVFYYYLTD